jgi:protein arginine kinase
MADATFIDMSALSAVEKEILRERRLISNELAQKAAGSGLVLSEDEGIAIMVNEEDHLRLQAISPGMNLKKVCRRINAIDSAIEQHIRYAFSHRLGYLTACPTNVGTGLRASVMMHLSGLRLMNEIEPAVNGLEKMGFAVRGLLGEGTEPHGNMLQISNQSTLGQGEEAIIDHLIEVVNEIRGHEENARLRLIQGKRAFLVDYIGRAYGILRNAHILPSGEAIDLLSGLRLGVHFGMITNLKAPRINEIMLLTQPGHLQKICGRTLGPAERDEVRAQIVKKKTENVQFCPDQQ